MTVSGGYITHDNNYQTLKRHCTCSGNIIKAGTSPRMKKVWEIANDSKRQQNKTVVELKINLFLELLSNSCQNEISL